MIFIHHEDIIVPENRIREKFPEKEANDLKESVREFGLIQPITVERQPDDKYTLRAGERRFRVLKALISEGHKLRCGVHEVPRDTIPAIEWADLDERQRVAIEVEENLKRLDFTFVERARAIERFHSFRKSENPKQTIQQTAAEIRKQPTAQGSQITEVSESLLIAQHLSDPDVAGAKDRKEALKVIRKKAEKEHRAKLAEKFDLSKTEHKLILGDSKNVVSTLPENSFDIILTDPPYGVGADSFGDQFSAGHDYEDSSKRLEDLLTWFPDESFRVAKERAHCYVFCDIRKFERIATLMVLAKWKVFPTPLIWFKWGGALPLPKHGPRRTYECILYAYKGNRETLVVKNDCIVRIPAVSKLKHGAQKPVALYCDLLSRSAQPGDTVLDCFGGSGTILVAANIKKLVATYIDDTKANYDIAVTRATTQEIDDGAEEDDGLRIDLS